MSKDLRLDKALGLARLMHRLHDDFRTRHGLPPVPTAWTLRDHLRSVGARSSLVDGAVMSSPRAVVGGPLNAARRAIFGVLRPIFYRQSEVNRDVLLALEALNRDSTANRGSHDALSARIADLETQVARLRRPEE